MAQRSGKGRRPGGIAGALLSQLKRFVGGHPIWMALLAGVAVSMACLIAVPFFLEPAVRTRQPNGWTPDWFSFFGSWIPGVVSALVGVVSIIMAVRISNQQAEQAKQLNDMQASLTMAMNLPSLHISRVRLRRTEDFLLAGHPAPGAGPRQYRLELHTPLDAFPAHYRVELLQCSWTFSGHSHEQPRTVQLSEKRWKLSPSHAGEGTCMALDFDCASQDRDYFVRFYEAPELNLDGIRSAQVVLELELENRLLASVLRSAGMGGGQEPKSTVELCISLRNSGKYLNEGGMPPREPDIVVEDYSVSVL